MLKVLQAWLNGTRDYVIGAGIFSILSDDEKLKKLFNAGESSWNKWKLGEELKGIYTNLKQQKASIAPKIPATSAIPVVKFKKVCKNNYGGKCQGKPAAAGLLASTKLLETCKLEADNAYKENMNDRAVLFRQVPANEFENANTPDLVECRRELCLAIVSGNIWVSELYDRVDHVKNHGHLPMGKPVKARPEVPDHLVKQAIDNLKKNIDKKKKRKQTPERIAMIQDDEARLEVLQLRWIILNPKNT